VTARGAGSPAWEEHLLGGGREAWVLLAYLAGGATAALFLYLGVRPGGPGPLWAYTTGRTALFLVAAALLLFGLGWSLLRRPVLQRGRLGAFGALAAAVWVTAYPLAYPSSHEGHPSAVRFRLPFDGAWTVRWGGSRGEENALVLQPDRRFGFDFVVCDADGQSDDGQGSLCRGRAVLAPAAGRVEAVHDGEPDAPFGGFPEGAEPYGNHVVLEVAAGEHLFLTGLERGSLRVAAGERIEAGAPIGRVGFSARSAVTPEAHLGLHLQDSPEPRRGECIPLVFRDYRTPAGVVESGVPRGGFRGGRHVGERVEQQPR
jgi:hypothetical protein